MNEENNPLLTIICTAYNHEKYIQECLEGLVIQQTNFAFEIIVHDDASTDKTQQIIDIYAKKYPKLFFNIYQTENQFSKADINIWYDIMLPQARGKYIAICEGDDYWTDPLKLQKQVDFLENNKEYVFCTHRYKVFYENEKCFDKKTFPLNQIFENNLEINREIFTKYWVSQPLCSVIVKEDFDFVLALYSNFNYYRDYHMFYFLLQRGKGICLSFCSGVYRINDGGIASSKTFYEKNKIAFFIYEELYLHTKDFIILLSYCRVSFIMVRKYEGFKIIMNSFFHHFTLKNKLILIKFYFIVFFNLFFGKIKNIFKSE